MNRGTWWATVYEVRRVKRDLETNHHQQQEQYTFNFVWLSCKYMRLKENQAIEV